MSSGSTDCLLFIVDLLSFMRESGFMIKFCAWSCISCYMRNRRVEYLPAVVVYCLLPTVVPFLREALKFLKLIRRTNKLIK